MKNVLIVLGCVGLLAAMPDRAAAAEDMEAETFARACQVLWPDDFEDPPGVGTVEVRKTRVVLHSLPGKATRINVSFEAKMPKHNTVREPPNRVNVKIKLAGAGGRVVSRADATRLDFHCDEWHSHRFSMIVNEPICSGVESLEFSFEGKGSKCG